MMQNAESLAHLSPVRFLNIISTKRSGHHALISWIEDSSRQNALFFNNSVMNVKRFSKLPAIARSQTEPTTIILNYEGISVAGVAQALAHQKETDFAIDKVLFIRDPLNVCASLMRRRSSIRVALFSVLRQLFALRNWLQHYRQNPAFADLVFYNRWLADEQYRCALAQRLALSPSPIRSEITKFGGGSSFGDLVEGGSAAAPKLLNRWKEYKDDPVFQSIVGSPHFVELFQAEANGAITDARGESDFDEERADYLEKLRRRRLSSSYICKMIDGLSHDQEIFEKVESTLPGVYKRSLIFRAHLRALFVRPSPAYAQASGV